MNRKKMGLLIVPFLIATLHVGFTVLPENVMATTLYVGGIGPSNHTAIQDAINASEPGDTIFVYNGTYSENIQVNKSLSVVGEDRNTTIIDGGKVGDVVNITASFTNFTGFTVMNSGTNLADKGIEIFSAHNCRIFNNNLHSNYRGGIFLWYSDGNNVTGNNISSNQDMGIGLYDSNHNTVADNEIWNNSYGISITTSGHNTVLRNTFLSVPYGAILGSSGNNTIADNFFLGNDVSIKLSRSVLNVVSNNTILDGTFGINVWSFSDSNYLANNSLSNNWLNGLYFVDSNNNTIYNNTISGSNEGLFFASSSDNVFRNNTISSNAVGFRLSFTSRNKIYHNRIVNNTLQAEDDSDTNQWDNGYPSGGNLWSDYTGADDYKGPDQNILGSDGIGDSAYMIDVDSVDRYPLVSLGTVFPFPPRNVTATLTGSKFENVTLAWDPSPDEPIGLVQRYDVYRSENHDVGGFLYQQIGSVPNGTHSFVDALAGEGNSSTYYYMVCTVNMANSSSCAEDQAGKFTKPLSVGPNLVSFPLNQSNESVDAVLQTVNWDKAWIYDSVTKKWKWHFRFKSYSGGLERVNLFSGVWVNVTEDSNLTIAGVVPTSTALLLRTGWNLVGFPSCNSSYTVADLKASISASRAEGFNPLGPYHLRMLIDSDTFQMGYGYWIMVDSEKTWIVEFS